MPFVWYTPTNVPSFGAVKNSDINANLNAIQAAFNAQNTWLLTQGALAVPATGPRNILVDLSATTTGSVTITLPAFPTVGDPPINIAIVATVPVAPGGAPNCAIVDANGHNIYGIASTVVDFAMMTPGDYVSLLYFGGTVGYVYAAYSASVAVNAPLTFIFQNNVSLTTLFHQLEIATDTSVGGQAASVAGINKAGLWAAVTRTGGSPTVTIGTSGETYNGIAGPFNISTSNVRYKFTCVALNTFMVTT
jgi:hypothetical protein